jgi:cytochrome c oxidase cbb3-type subunit 4
MDVNDLRTVATVICFVIFIGIVVWTYSRRNREDFEEASKLPFDQD